MKSGHTNRPLGYPGDARLLMLLAIEGDSRHTRPSDYEFLVSSEVKAIV